MKVVATFDTRLDAAGDAKDMAGTQQNYDKLMTVPDSLRSVRASSL